MSVATDQEIRATVRAGSRRSPSSRPDEAAILMVLARWGSHLGLPAPTAADSAPENSVAFELPATHERLVALCEYFDAIGLLYDQNLIRDDLLFPWLDALHGWSRAQAHAAAERTRRDGPRRWTNLESLAAAQKRRTMEYST